MAATRYADVRRWWNGDDTWWRGSDATWSNSEPAFGSGVVTPSERAWSEPAFEAGINLPRYLRAARDEVPSRVDAAFAAYERRRRERLVRYSELGRGVHAQLVAIRIGHLLEYLNECGECTLMQLGISWWREVRVSPPVFANEAPQRYLDIVASDRLHAALQATPLLPGAVRLQFPVGYHVLDGKSYHEC